VLQWKEAAPDSYRVFALTLHRSWVERVGAVTATSVEATVALVLMAVTAVVVTIALVLASVALAETPTGHLRRLPSESSFVAHAEIVQQATVEVSSLPTTIMPPSPVS